MTQTEKQINDSFKALPVLTQDSTMEDLIMRRDVPLRTTYRYLVLQNLGFLFELIADHVYKLIQSNQKKHLTISLVKQEMDLILDQLPEERAYYNSIRDKLYIYSDIKSRKVLAADFGLSMQLVDAAIHINKRVILYGYSSAHKNQKEDYCIEPGQLDDIHQRLYAFDLGARDIRQFKTERIDSVDMLKQAQWYTDRYSTKNETDYFGWRIEDATWDIELEMSWGVYRMIKEENPGIAKGTIELEGNWFLLTTTVADLRPVMSMVLRFPGEIKVIKPSEIEEEAARRLQKLDFFENYFKALSYGDNLEIEN